MEIEDLTTNASPALTDFTICNTAGAGGTKKSTFQAVGDLLGVGFYQKSLEMSTAQVLALFTTPRQIIASPGAGKAIQVISAFARIPTYGGVIYATNTTLLLNTTTGIGTEAQALNDQMLLCAGAVSKQFTTQAGQVSATSQLHANEPLLVSVLNGNPTAGNSNIEVYVAYRIITLI